MYEKPLPQLTEDGALVRALKQNSESAFRTLFDKYYQKIYRVSKRMGLSEPDAEEIIQQVFLIVWEQRNNLDEELSFNAFLLTLSKRTVIKRMRRKLIEVEYQSNQVPFQTYQTNFTEEEILYNDLKTHALDMIKNLPPVRKQIFIMSKKEGLSNDEIAEKLGVSKRTVENHLYRAIKGLKVQLEKISDVPAAFILYMIATYL